MATTTPYRNLRELADNLDKQRRAIIHDAGLIECAAAGRPHQAASIRAARDAAAQALANLAIAARIAAR